MFNSLLAVAGPDLFVANGPGTSRGSVTEVDATTGALVRVLSAQKYAFSGPSALAVVGPDLFVASNDDFTGGFGSVTEVDISTGALVRVISSPSYGFAEPIAMVADHDDLFVANGGASGPAGRPTARLGRH